MWHYTCAHGRAALGEGGTLLPPLWQVESVPGGFPVAAYALLGLIWATPTDAPDRLALGLTSATIDCDRMRFRYSVPAEAFTPWGRMRHRMPTEVVDALELSPGAEPASWWVADRPVEGARLDRGWP